MKDKDDKRLELVGDEELEARVIAWILGEASEFEAEELEERCRREPELAVFVRRMRHLHGLLEENHRSEEAGDWRLAEARREVVEGLWNGSRAGEKPAEGKVVRYFARRAWLAAAACLLLALIALPLVWQPYREARFISAASEVGAARAPQGESVDEIIVYAAPAEEEGEPMVVPPASPEPRHRKAEAAGAAGRESGIARRESVDGLATELPASGSGRVAAADKPAMDPFAANRDFGAGEAYGEGRGLTQTEGDEAPPMDAFAPPAEEVNGLATLARGGGGGGGAPSTALSDADDLGLEAGKRAERRALDRNASGDDLHYFSYSDEGGVGGPPGGVVDGRWRDPATKSGDAETSSRLQALRAREGQLGSGADADFDRAAGLPMSRRAPEADAKPQRMLKESSELQPLAGLELAEMDGELLRREKGREWLLEELTFEDDDLTRLNEAQLDAWIRVAELTVEERRRVLTQIIRSEQIPYAGVGTGTNGEQNEANAAADPYSRLMADKVRLGSQIKTFESFEDEQLIAFAAGLQLPENIVRTLYPQYLEAQRQLEALKAAGLGPDHPNVRRQVEFIEGMRGDLEEATVALSETLKAQLELANEQLQRLSGGGGEAESVSSDIARETFEAARNQFLQAQKQLEKLKLRKATLHLEREARQLETRVELTETATAEQPVSTFSLHVGDASFKLAAAALRRGEVPAAESIRPEEFYNAFDYGDPAPGAGEPVACALEQAAHPLLPQRNLLRVAVRTGAAGRLPQTPLNLTLLVDNSGSMERADRAEGLDQAVGQLAGLLQPGDQVTVAGFARRPRLIAERIDGGDAAKLKRAVREVPAEGGTNLEEALDLGTELAMRQYAEGAQNRIVLFTDGAANLGDADPESLQRGVELLRQNDIAFDAAGLGAEGLNDRMLERLTRNGNGRYYVVDEPGDADSNFARQLAGAFRPAAENVKVQVRFNPQRVAGYRLIGFEEHRLREEDFRNDAVDAAELAAEEAGVALYQYQFLPEGSGEVGEVAVRFRDAASGRMVERRWTIPYEAQAPGFDEAAPSMQLAGLAALVAERLRGAPMAEAIRFGDFDQVLAEVRAQYAGSPRVAELENMIQTLKR